MQWKYGRGWEDDANELTIELGAFLAGITPEEGGLGKYWHCRNAIDLLWNYEGSTMKFDWHPWAERMIEEACENKYLSVAGCASCVSGDTRILDPLTGEQPTIQSLCEKGERPWVMTLNGPVLAEVPHLKGRAELYEFTLSSGATFKCTAEHRLLTSSGWILSKDASVGSFLFGYVPGLPGSSSDSDPSGLPQDARRCCQTVGGYPEHCSVYFRPDDEQLRLARASDLGLPPSPDGVQVCSDYASERWGALSHERGCNRPCRSDGPSTHSVLPLRAKPQTPWSPRSVVGTSLLRDLWFRLVGQSQRGCGLLRKAVEPVLDFVRTQCCDSGRAPLAASGCCFASKRIERSLEGSQGCRPLRECSGFLETSSQSCSLAQSNRDGLSYPLKVEHLQVVSIKSLGVDDFYDVHVPGEEHYFAEGGIHHNSGKSDSFAVYGIVCFLADPVNTRVLVTSTTLKDSRLRIWGRIKEYWNALPGAPGKLVDSQGLIKYVDPETGIADESSGIVLIAGESKKEKESIKKLIGFKRRRIVLLADELPELSPTILEAALSNLDSNPFFQLVGIGNPNSRFDAHGVFSKPKDGWGSVPATADEWETDLGKCIRFDAELSPNVIAGTVLYPYLCTEEKLTAKKRELGEDSLLYWRMFRGFWCPTGSESGIYSEADITQFGADDRVVRWSTIAERIAFLDTTFTAGGDRAMAYFGWVGESMSGNKVLLFDEEGVVLSEDVSSPKPFGYQIAEQFRDLCKREKVPVSSAGLDTTGGGAPFGDILSVVWGSGFHRCLFSGSASSKPVSASDTRTCEEAFTNRVSELWGIGPQYVRSGQIKGIGKELAREMTSRLYTTVGTKVSVESKKKMKARTGKSPDAADAAFGLLDLARERFGFECIEGEIIQRNAAESGGSSMTWDAFVASSDRLYGGETNYDPGFMPLQFR